LKKLLPFFIFITMPIKIPGVGLPACTKRTNPESFDNPPIKKARNADGQMTDDVKSKDSEARSTIAKPMIPSDSVVTGESETSGKDANLETKNEMELELTHPETAGQGVEANNIQFNEGRTEEGILTNDGTKASDIDDRKVTEPGMTEEQVTPKKPPAGYLMNVNGALVEAHQGTPFREVVNLPLTVLKGIDELQANVLSEHFFVKTLRDLANWKFYQIAKSIQTLAKAEENAGRLETSLQNINDAVDKKFEKKSLAVIVEQKAEVLQGIGKYLQGQLSKKLGITTMKDLANYKPAEFAAALVALADYETTGFESKTTPNDSKPLSTFRPVVG